MGVMCRVMMCWWCVTICGGMCVWFYIVVWFGVCAVYYGGVLVCVVVGVRVESNYLLVFFVAYDYS